MDTLYIKVSIKKSDTDINAIRNEGLLFENIADAINLDRNSIEEIDENNFIAEIQNIKNKYTK